MNRFYALIFFMVVSLPALYVLMTYQSHECDRLRTEIRRLEIEQNDRLNDRKAIGSEINILLAVDNLENEALKMGFQKMPPEDVILITLGGGKEHGY